MSDSPRLQKLFESVDLAALHARETEHKQPGASVITDSGLPQGDFHEKTQVEMEQETTTSSNPEPTPVPQPQPQPNDKPYDAEANAQSLVYGLQGLKQPILTGAVMGKLYMQSGGKATHKKWKAVIQKKNNGEKLTEAEERMLEAKLQHDNKMVMLSDACIPSEKKMEYLIKIAQPYVEKTQMDVPEGLAFWGAWTGSLIEDLTKIFFA